jgi:hypothetical protein
VDWSVANNSGIVGALVSALPSVVVASASTATTVGGTALYSFGDQQLIAGTLGFYDVAAGSATNLFFEDYLTQPAPYTGVPEIFRAEFPSSVWSDPMLSVYCTLKCY